MFHSRAGHLLLSFAMGSAPAADHVPTLLADCTPSASSSNSEDDTSGSDPPMENGKRKRTEDARKTEGGQDSLSIAKESIQALRLLIKEAPGGSSFERYALREFICDAMLTEVMACMLFTCNGAEGSEEKLIASVTKAVRDRYHDRFTAFIAKSGLKGFVDGK